MSERIVTMTNIVRTFNLGKDHEVQVLKGCDFHMDRGEFVSIIGQSGSGKSTLMNIIGLLDTPTAGTYELEGTDVLRLDDDEAATYRSLNIGFVFQNFNLIGRSSALSNVEIPMMYAGVGRRERRERAEALLELVDMGDRMHHQPNELSGGQKQRVAIARALANEPTLLLADEPTGALDSSTGRMVMDMFHALNQERGTSIIFITHNPDLAGETSRIVEMKDGFIVHTEEADS
ncbi:ABC transporter ATP-binding protein [Corynebacterium uterequi]|uniref:ABC-type antimicrobial peptide transport system, ATPase component n=1 Tax=Corynebacterium uterequi TaxID=1072256 RepID=A0A0G3HJA2_9CORY|nr:ABC transporter ATP-binding protein [Corynebacterium uterequi]AKK11182.1 ABC-type antimicrobial peptide transport system, ATPase component [Corynebacterium uterequi]